MSASSRSASLEYMAAGNASTEAANAATIAVEYFIVCSVEVLRDGRMRSVCRSTSEEMENYILIPQP